VLPGLPGRADARLAALIPNDCGNFRDAWVHLKAVDSKCVFTQGLGHLALPIRHGEGKFYAEGPVLAELADRGQIALKYAGPSGNVARGRFPHNPNGSLLDIAGICDATGRVLGLMPHPEAHIASFQHPAWTREKEAWRRRGEAYPEQVGAGLAIFQNAVRYLQDQA
jgi:phosphoribosylformylglycinamidine synthase